MAYKSRTKRRDDACESLRNIVEKLYEISDFLEDTVEETEDIKDKVLVIQKIDEALALMEGVDIGELESLKDEMESWASNMEGTNLEYTSRYETVTEAASALEDVVSGLEVSVPDIDKENLTVDSIKEFADDIRQIADSIESAMDDAEGIEFPGMYG